MCGVATLAFAGRGLGVILFGTLILITSYVKAVSGIAKFQSWQLIVRYGGHGVAHGDPEHFKVATGFAFALDMVSGIAGLIVGAALLPFIGTWVGIDAAISLAGNALLHPAADHELGDARRGAARARPVRPDQLVGHRHRRSRARSLAGIAFVAGRVLPGLCRDLVRHRPDRQPLHLVSSAGASSSATDCSKESGRRLKPAALPGAWRFAIDVNLATSVQAVWGPIGRLVVGGLLGPAGAALFRVASTLADSAQKPADLLGKAFYPEIMRMDLTSKKPWKLMLRGTALVSAIAVLAILLMLVGGKPLMALIFGKAFLGAYAPLVILMAIPFIGIFSFPLTPMLYALGRSDAPLKAKLLGSADLLRHHRALVLGVGRRRRGDRAGPRQCRQHRSDDGPTARRAPPRAARRPA